MSLIASDTIIAKIANYISGVRPRKALSIIDEMIRFLYRTLMDKVHDSSKPPTQHTYTVTEPEYDEHAADLAQAIAAEAFFKNAVDEED